ncbi:MAG: NAD(P)-dependent alcohol dehydrogenase [Chloroflexi bacterium]|nr:MAG: NAD(P)-dependent alcohol dehydrogenase [Chloroflexota bacterium]
MKAILYEKYGPPEVALKLTEVVKPVPVNHQVLVKVRAASVNAKEWRGFTMPSLLVRFFGGGWSKPKDPSIGTDVAGVVEAVGENVTRFKPGDEVFGGAHGSFAEYALAREAYLTLKPANRSFEEAACLPIAAITALQAIRYASGIRAGQQVLIQGASGGIGMFAIQLAKASGADVTAVCSTRNLDLARSWGADHAIDYTIEDFTKSGGQYDLILGINGYHSLFSYRQALKPRGVYVCAGGEMLQLLQAIIFGKLFSQKGGKTLGSMGITKFNQDDLAYLGKLLKDGTIVPVIDRSYPLDETVQALRYVIDKHARGKVVITVG